MESTLVVPGAVVIPRGRTVVVTEHVDDEGRRRVVRLADEDAGIRFVHDGSTPERTEEWAATVVSCTVTLTGDGQRTALVVDRAAPAVEPIVAEVRAAASEADDALREADAAVDSARAEALRWGGADRGPATEQPRFW